MKFETPKIDPKKTLGNLDALANKVPDDIAKLIKKILLALFVFFLLVAVYYGWTLGYGENNTEGLKLAEDQKAIFREDIEREYNRKRKNIRLSDIELDISNRAEERMIREEISRKQTNPNYILTPSNKPLDDESSLYNSKEPDPFPAPTNPKEDIDFLPGKDESTKPVLDRKDNKIPMVDKLESLEKAMQYEEEKSIQLEKTLDRLEKLEKKRDLVKPR